MKIKNVTGAPLLLCIISALLIALQKIDFSFLNKEQDVYLTVIALQVIVFAIPTVIYARWRGKGFLAHLRVRFFKIRDIPVMIYGFLIMTLGGALICFLMYRFFPDAFAASSQSFYIGDNVSMTAGKGIYTFISFAVLPAITEEFLYRGVILTEYERNGVFIAVIMNSLCFSLIHFSFIRLPIYFFYGIILSIVLYATRSVIATVTVHMANNIFVLFFEVYVYRAAVKKGGGIIVFGLLLTALTLFVCFLFFLALQRNYYDLAERNVPSKHAIPKKNVNMSYWAEVIMSPMLALLIAISAVGMFIT